MVQARETPAPLVTKNATPAAPETLEEFVARYGTHRVTYKGLFEALKPTLKSYQAKLAALEKRIKEQDARVLELEAEAAARTEPQHHAER